MPERLRRGIEVVETCLLVGLLTAMLGVAVYQIVARNAFGAGVSGARSSSRWPSSG